MWSHRKALRSGLLALSLMAGAGMLSACSFTPLYGDQGAVQRNLQLVYAKPNSRLEQIIYQDLALRLGHSASADAPAVHIAINQTIRKVSRTSSGSPATTYELKLSGTASVVRDGETVYSVNRSASASYKTNGQLLADQYAEQDAGRRAALAFAQIIRLSLAANLPGKL